MANILYFSTTWCGPCKAFKPVVQEVAAETGKAVQYIDAEQNAQLAAQYNVTGVPTIIVAEGNTVMHRHTGAMSKQQLKSFFSSLSW